MLIQLIQVISLGRFNDEKTCDALINRAAEIRRDSREKRVTAPRGDDFSAKKRDARTGKASGFRSSLVRATRCRLDVLNKSGSRTPIEISPRVELDVRSAEVRERAPA